MIDRTGSRIAACALLASTALASRALAQQAEVAPPPRQSIDQNGVDLATGMLSASTPSISIGSAAQGLSFSRRIISGGAYAGWGNPYAYALIGTASTTVQAVTGDTSISFNFDTGTSTYINQQGTGETLTLSGTTWTLTLRDGTIVTLDNSMFDPNATVLFYYGKNTLAAARSIVFPNKQKLTFAYRMISWEGLNDFDSRIRLQSVQSSSGYMAKYEYADNGSGNTSAWRQITKVTLLNNATDYCNPTADTCTFSQSWPALTFTYVTGLQPEVDTVTDSLNRSTVFTYGNSGYFAGNLHAIRRPTSATDDVTAVYGPSGVTSVTIDGRTWNYSWSLAAPLMTATITNPDSSQKVYVTNTTTNEVTSYKDELNRTTTYQYDTYGRLTDLIYPEGNKLHYTYDAGGSGARGNVTEARTISKTPGTPADIVKSAVYPSTCANAVTCNRPTSITDPRGNETDYTYDTTHGGVLTVTSPAPTTGAVRPQTRYGYTALQAYYKNSSGSIVASGQPTYLLTSTSTCQTLSSCSGGADEVKTAITYGPQVAGTANNLLPVSVSKGSGDGVLTATSAYTYDNVGNLTYVDGPLSGTADTTRIIYDAGRQVIGRISPDPDGGGPLPNRAIRLTYNADGQLTKQEQGTTAGQTDTAWASFTPAASVSTSYDSSGRKSTETLQNGSTSYALTQYSYDSVGRLSCTATRMNPSVYGSLPSSACTLSTQGSNGPDQISEITYDAASEPTQLQVGVGTTDAANERTLTYNNNGTVASLTDGENNKTSYAYDGFDRASQTQYPSTTKGAGTSNTADYEQLSYDAASNVTSRRLRDGTSISYTFDNLSRVTLKTLPNSEPAVTYAYDNLGRLTSASQTGNALSFTYDALSRNLTETGPQGTVTSAYDLAGRRTLVTYPGSGLYVSYDYLLTGEVSAIRENGGTSGVGVLASYAYDNLGHRTGLTFGNGATQTYAYDAVSRLQTLTNNLAGTGNSLTIGGSSTPITYNPASQILSSPRSNDSYAFPGYYNVNRGYTSDGLNRYTVAGTASFTYDARGNLTSDGTNSYSYSSENLLKSAPSSTALSYDPFLRLYQIAGAATTRFAYDGLNMLAEYDGSNNLQRRFVFDGGGQPIVWYEGSGTTTRRFLSSDERGSIISLTDSSGTLVGINSYDEYGIPASTNLGRFGYTGLAWLGEIGLQYSRARIYSPTLGRFLQTDPIGYGDGPNWYAYTHNDPLNSTDPLGLAGGCDPSQLGSCTSIDICGNCNYQNAPIETPLLPASLNVAPGTSKTSPIEEIIIRGRRLQQKHPAHRIGPGISYGNFACNFAPLSSADKRLVDRAMSDPKVRAAMINAWSKTVQTGNEQSFFVYQNSNGGFLVGHPYTGTSTTTSENMVTEYQYGSGQPVINFHTHPTGADADNFDADFNINTNTIGIIATPSGTRAGRQCK
jgi:RHS repeat-associated protein